MKTIISRLKLLFPGKKFSLLLLNVFALFLVSLFDMLGIAVILPIIQIVADGTVPAYLAPFVSDQSQEGQRQLVLLLGSLLVGSFIFKGIFSLLVKWWSSGFIAYQQTATSVNLLRQLMHDPYLVHRTRTTPEVLRTVNDATGQVYTNYVGGILAVVGESFSIMVLMGLLLAVMPVTALLALAYFSLAAYLLQRFLKKKNTEQGVKIMESSVGAMNAALESIVGFRENRMHGVTDRYVYRYQQRRLVAVDASRRGTFYQDIPKYLLEVIFIVGITLLLAYTAFTDGASSAPYLLLFAGASVRVLPSFTRLVASLGNVRLGSKAMNILEKDLARLSAAGQENRLIETDPVIGDFAEVQPAITPINLEIKDLSFHYPDSPKNVLEKINLTIPSGSSVAFVGGSGSGKTTLVDLILGLFEPTGGQVLVNGQSISENIPAWHSKIGYVPQNVFLGDSTVREAIAFGLRPEEIDEERVLECVRIAELEDLIASLEHGLDHMIGENGTRLSGGQRQRLGIARALYRNPSLLVMDEATSALDNETEHKITKTIEEISKKITVIIVAHRLSTVRKVNQLIYLEKGQIRAQGSFEEVEATNPQFAKLVKLGKL